jgi:hypothetical protein
MLDKLGAIFFLNLNFISQKTKKNSSKFKEKRVPLMLAIMSINKILIVKFLFTYFIYIPWPHKVMVQYDLLHVKQIQYHYSLGSISTLTKQISIYFQKLNSFFFLKFYIFIYLFIYLFISIIYYNIVIWVVKLFIVIAYDNYDDF